MLLLCAIDSVEYLCLIVRRNGTCRAVLYYRKAWLTPPSRGSKFASVGCSSLATGHHHAFPSCSTESSLKVFREILDLF